MALFKLLVGQHIATDPDSPELTPEQIKVGAKRPSRTYPEGSTIESDEDLAAKHGAAKFVLLSGTPKKVKGPKVEASAAPGGQVSTGFQSATGTPQGTISGPALDKEVEGDAKAETAEKGSPPKTREEVEASLQRMNVQQLRNLAQQEGIDLHGKNTKAEIVNHIMAVKDD